MSKNFSLLILFSTLLLSSCGDKPKVEAIRLATGTVESTVTTINSGTVEAQSQAELAFGTVGRIAKIYVTLGSKVKNGAIIAELENADLKAVYDESQKELARTEELYKNGLVSIANLDAAKRAREVGRLNYEKTVMRAPFDGMITAMDLKIGEYYQSATSIDKKPAVQIIDLKKRLIKGEIDEVDLQRVAAGYPARIKIPALRNQIFNARVTKVVPFVSTAKDQDRTSQIELEIVEAPKGVNTEKENNVLIPVGASADVEIISETKSNVKILPTSVLFGTGKTRSLYKIIKGKLEKAEVKLGVGNYERAEILSGISATDLIARPLNGLELTEGMKVEATEKTWP
jgi:RND family efflux transporter MFP subunit